MTASVLQETSDTSGTNESTVSQAFSSNATPGSVIHVILIANGAGITGGFGTPSDGTNTYNLLDKAQATNYAIGHWWAANSSSGILTISEALGITTTQHLWIIREIGGVQQSVDGHNATFNNSTSNGANAMSIAATSANQPNFSSAVGWAFNSTSTAVGTTLAWVQGQLNLVASVMGGHATTESLRLTSTGSTTATWTNNSNAVQSVSCIAIFDELVSTGASIAWVT